MSELSMEWKQGYTLKTLETRLWTKEQFAQSDAIEGRMIFGNFHREDAGRSRIKIAECITAEVAADIVEIHNELYMGRRLTNGGAIINFAIDFLRNPKIKATPAQLHQAARAVEKLRLAYRELEAKGAKNGNKEEGTT